MAVRIRKEHVICATINCNDVIIREYSIVKVKMNDGFEVTGALKNIKDDNFDIDCSKQYSSEIFKVWNKNVESIEVIQE